MVHENSLKNLIPGNKRGSKEMSKLGHIAGLKSVEVKRKKKKMRELIQTLLSMPTKLNRVKGKMAEMGFEEEDMTNQLHMILSVYKKAIQGDISAAIFMRDTAGEKPAEKQEISGAMPVIISGEDKLE